MQQHDWAVLYGKEAEQDFWTFRRSTVNVRAGAAAASMNAANLERLLLMTLFHVGRQCMINAHLFKTRTPFRFHTGK